jgi:hypothetical protein
MTGIWVVIWVLVIAGPWVAMIYALFTKSAKARFWICRSLSVLFALAAVIAIVAERNRPEAWNGVVACVVFGTWMWWLSGRDPNRSR